jgi:Secretion system C-terminal sorting domain
MFYKILTHHRPMKKLLFLTGIFSVLQANAQDYLITFAGTGPAKNVSTVMVENLTKGTSLILSGSDVLHLKDNIATGIIDNKLISGLKIYPNPMIDNSTVEVVPPVPGGAIVSIFDMSGIQVTQIQSYFDNSTQEFRLSGTRKGFCIVNVRGSNYQFSGKLICNGNSGEQ